MQRGISDKRGGTVTTENEIGLPRMDSFQNPCSEFFLYPGSTALRTLPRYLPLEENLWQIVLTVGVVAPGARNTPTVYRPRESGHSRCSRFCKRRLPCLLLPDRVKTGSEHRKKEPAVVCCFILRCMFEIFYRLTWETTMCMVESCTAVI